MNELQHIFRNKYKHIDKPNPNYKSRPNGVDGIIIHSMGERIKGYGSASNFLEENDLSAHYLIKPSGTVIECVDPIRQAYHAGKSKLGLQTNLNTSFIGIEVLVPGEHDYISFLETIKTDIFTEKQYDSTAVLTSLLCGEFNIELDRVVRHSDVSGPDVRDDPKKDPGQGFRWNHFIALTNEFINQLTAKHEDE